MLIRLPANSAAASRTIGELSIRRRGIMERRSEALRFGWDEGLLSKVFGAGIHSGQIPTRVDRPLKACVRIISEGS